MNAGEPRRQLGRDDKMLVRRWTIHIYTNHSVGTMIKTSMKMKSKENNTVINSRYRCSEPEDKYYGIKPSDETEHVDDFNNFLHE